MSVNDSQALNLAASSVGSGSLTVTADGITESGPIVQAAVAGAATFNAGNANLTLDQSGNKLTGLVTLKNSGTAAITLVNATSLNVSQVTAGSGGVNLQAAGALTLGQALGVGNAISTGGAVDLATTTGDVTLQQSIQSTAGGVTVNSGGAINMAAGTLVDAGSDPLSLAATGSIFVAALQTTSAAFTAVNLSSQTGQVAASGHASTNITSAGGLNISADNGIGSGDPLQVSVGSITVQNAQIGDIDIASLQPTTLLSALQGVGGNIVITSAGTMTVGLPGLTTAPAAVSTAGSGGITLSADGTAAALVLDQGVSGAGSAVNLTADGAVILAGAVPVTSTAGDINVTAAGSSITMASSSLLKSSSGAIALNAASGVLVSSITTGSTVSVTSATQSIAVVVGLPNSVNITAGGAALSAATGIGTVTAPIVTSVGTLAASNSTRNDIQAVNVGTGLLTIGTVGTTQGIQLSGGVPATINVSTAGPMQVTGNVLNTTGGNIMLTSGGTGSLTTVGRVVTSGGNGSITLSTAGNLNIEDAVNQGIAPAFWTPDIQVSGSGQIIGNAAGQVAIGSNVLVQSGTGSVTEAPPAIGTIVIPQINSDGIATITAPVGRPGDTDLTVTIDWHDGSTTTLLDVAGGAITAAHHYLVNPNLANGAAPIPMTVTVSGDPNISFAGKTIATATATISGTGLFLAYQGLTVPVQAPIIIIVRIEERPAQVVEVVSVDGWIEVVQPRPKQAPGEERVVTMNLVPPGGGAPVPFQLPENVTDDLPALFKRLPDGHYQIFVDEPGRQPRMLIDVYLRQGRPVDPDDKFEGTEDRPPTAMFEAAPTRILISQALPAAKIENRDATAAEFADRALAASLQSPAPAAAIASRGRRVAVHDRHAESAGRWSSSAATVGVAALAGLVVLRPAGNQHTEDERAQLADRTLGHLNGQRLDRAARWSRRVRRHLPLWMPFARSDNRSQEPA
ncbi:MAG TPA: hypothetical protein VHV55_11320 [Pirellulales bacterium]|nr:hypothetical protein [Pirellulales bacterium]